MTLFAFLQCDPGSIPDRTPYQTAAAESLFEGLFSIFKIVFNVAFSPVSERLERSSRYTRKGLDQTVPTPDR